jgi:flagellar motor protein MotB
LSALALALLLASPVVTTPENAIAAQSSVPLLVLALVQVSERSLIAKKQNFPNSTVNVIGHTDSDGTAAFNQDLSARRAQAVSSVLIQSGVSPNRIRSIGRGEDAPIASNLNAEGKRQNRRVEITITPNG